MGKAGVWITRSGCRPGLASGPSRTTAMLVFGAAGSPPGGGAAPSAAIQLNAAAARSTRDAGDITT